MNPDSGRLSEALVRAVGHSQAYHQSHHSAIAPALPAMTIAISRQMGALGTTIARELGGRLGWPVYDHELLERMAQELNVHVELLESIDERHIPWLVERIEEFSSIPYVSENTYVRRLIETMLSLGARGNCIIVGRGSTHILPPVTTLRVRLVAPFNDRVQTIMREQILSSAEAARRVKEVNDQRNAFLRNHFHFDPDMPENYDLLINVSHLTVAACADVILAALRDRENHVSHGAVVTDKLALQWH